MNLAVNCAVNEGLCDQMCELGDPEAGTLDHCLCRAGFTLDSSGRKCLGRYQTYARSSGAVNSDDLRGQIYR